MIEPIEPEQTQRGNAHSGTAMLTVEAKLSASVSIRNYLSGQHLWNARREAWLCRKREDLLLAEPNADLRLRSHAMASVLSAVAFLEAVANEVWQDAADRQPGHIEGIPDTAVSTMRELWNGKDRAERMLSVLSKFQVALVCAGQAPMDRGSEPYQSANVLIGLRNALVHFTPRWWHDDGRDEAAFVAKLRDKLVGRENRQPIAEPWYPNKVLAAGCADWACDSVIAFAREWHARIGLTSDFDQRYLMPSEPFEVA
ncbi:hypothetical protein C0J29_13755 [Mycobacterium paragordonae]|uniref:Uncharacterized protein n=1 Tax=Mycobacterium paragordonae TaxID=1389713 RepID=A0ABQ1C3V7_9MYCO|nr:hypothetical protein [Mycobacterium paragordonae]AYE95710.1 hypothetical protein C0J29_13755 [Mycobacterium paragordonae]GFG78976.1 hypothetical protein MPRG_22520 [Mycobacterium paragordonae]